jgi:hypothetical protein
MTDIKKMQLGQVVDFVIAYNERQKRAEKQAERGKGKRKAAQSDINAFFG